MHKNHFEFNPHKIAIFLLFISYAKNKEIKTYG